MKKFYLSYIILYTAFALVFIGLNLLDLNFSYALWNSATSSTVLPVAFILGIPAFLSLIATAISMLLTRPVVRRYSNVDLAIDGGVVLFTVFLAWVCLKFTFFLEPLPEFRLAYNALVLGSGLSLGLNIALFRRIVSVPAEQKTNNTGEEPPLPVGNIIKKPVSFGFAFYSMMAILSMLALCIGMLMTAECWDYGNGDTGILMCGLFGLSCLIAIFAYYLTERLLRRSVFGGMVLFIAFIGGFGLSGASFIYYTFDNVNTNYTDFGHHYSEDDDVSYDDDYEYEYYNDEEGYDGYEDYPFEEDEYYETLDPACIENESDYELFEVAVRYFNETVSFDDFADYVPYELLSYYTGQSAYDSDAKNAYRRVASFLFKYSPRIIMQSIAERHIRNLLRVVTVDDYYGSKGYSRIVDYLIDAYDDLWDEDGDSYGAWKMLEVYEVMSREHTGEWYDWSGYYFEGLIPFISVGRVERYRMEDGTTDVPMIVWAYSFWGRRANESIFNPSDIYRALNYIRDNYRAEEN